MAPEIDRRRQDFEVHDPQCQRGTARRAASVELIERNVASIVKPPKAEATKPAIVAACVAACRIADVLRRMHDLSLDRIAAPANGAGARRGEFAGEITALSWADLGPETATPRRR